MFGEEESRHTPLQLQPLPVFYLAEILELYLATLVVLLSALLKLVAVFVEQISFYLSFSMYTQCLNKNATRRRENKQ